MQEHDPARTLIFHPQRAIGRLLRAVPPRSRRRAAVAGRRRDPPAAARADHPAASRRARRPHRLEASPDGRRVERRARQRDLAHRGGRPHPPGARRRSPEARVHPDRASPRLPVHRADRDRCAVLDAAGPIAPPRRIQPRQRRCDGTDAGVPSCAAGDVAGPRRARRCSSTARRSLGLDGRPALARPRAVVRVNVAFPSEQAPVPSLNAHPDRHAVARRRALRLRGRRTRQRAIVPAGDEPIRRRAASRHGRRARSVLLARRRLGRLLRPGQPQEGARHRGRSRRSPGALRDGDRRRRRLGVGERDRVRARTGEAR